QFFHGQCPSISTTSDQLRNVRTTTSTARISTLASMLTDRDCSGRSDRRICSFGIGGDRDLPNRHSVHETGKVSFPCLLTLIRGAALGLLLLVLPAGLGAQELTPGAYWPLPRGMNIVTVVNSFNWGD